MPIQQSNRIVERLRQNWRIENGHYLAQIIDVYVQTIEDGRMPICWSLMLLEEKRRVEKLHWIDKEGGVNLLVKDLQALGKQVTPETAIEECNSLIGAKILVSIDYNGDYQNISFLRRIDLF